MKSSPGKSRTTFAALTAMELGSSCSILVRTRFSSLVCLARFFSATLTSALIPWNTCGAYMSATLGVATFSYAPYAFFNLLCPVIAIIYGFASIAQKPLEDTEPGAVAAAE